MNFNYPTWICADCGKKYGTYNDKHVSCCHQDTCGWCGESKSVTEPRDFAPHRLGGPEVGKGGDD